MNEPDDRDDKDEKKEEAKNQPPSVKRQRIENHRRHLSEQKQKQTTELQQQQQQQQEQEPNEKVADNGWEKMRVFRFVANMIRWIGQHSTDPIKDLRRHFESVMRECAQNQLQEEMDGFRIRYWGSIPAAHKTNPDCAPFSHVRKLAMEELLKRTSQPPTERMIQEAMEPWLQAKTIFEWLHAALEKNVLTLRIHQVLYAATAGGAWSQLHMPNSTHLLRPCAQIAQWQLVSRVKQTTPLLIPAHLNATLFSFLSPSDLYGSVACLNRQWFDTVMAHGLEWQEVLKINIRFRSCINLDHWHQLAAYRMQQQQVHVGNALATRVIHLWAQTDALQLSRLLKQLARLEKIIVHCHSLIRFRPSNWFRVYGLNQEGKVIDESPWSVPPRLHILWHSVHPDDASQKDAPSARHELFVTVPWLRHVTIERFISDKPNKGEMIAEIFRSLVDCSCHMGTWTRVESYNLILHIPMFLGHDPSNRLPDILRRSGSLSSWLARRRLSKIAQSWKLTVTMHSCDSLHEVLELCSDHLDVPRYSVTRNDASENPN